MSPAATIVAMFATSVDWVERSWKGRNRQKPAVQVAFGSVVILLATFLVYLPSLQGVFLWDDAVTLTNNPLVLAPDGLYDIWFSTRPYDYWPLTYTSLWLEWRIWEMNPTGYRVTNMLLHAAGCIVLWRVLLRLRIPGAWVVAMVFAVHPVCVASTAWISERKNVLSLVFYLLSILWYLRADEQELNSGKGRSRIPSRFYWLSLGAFLLALFSKTSVVMLPFVLLLCVWWLRTRNGNIEHPTQRNAHSLTHSPAYPLTFRDLARTFPFFALSFVMGLVTIWFQNNRAIGAGESTGPLLERLVSGSWAIWFYFYKAILPVNLSVLYQRWIVNPHTLISYIPFAAWLLILFVCWRFRNRWSRPLLFSLAYFSLTLLPVFGFFDMSYLALSRAADHWQYLALIGPVTLIVAGGTSLLTSWPTLTLLVRVVIASGLIISLGLLSGQRARLYADAELLWRDALEKDPKSRAAYNDLGVALVNKGRLDEALPLFEKAIEINPKGAPPRNNMGMAFFEKGQVDEAIKFYRQAIELDAFYTPARFNLAVALTRKEKWDEAAESYTAVLASRPDSAEAHNNLGNILARLGQTNEAKFRYAEAVRLRSGFAEAQNNLANAFRAEGNIEQALKHYRNAIKIRPAYSNARIRLGEYAMMRGKPAEADEHFAYALAEQPESAEAHTGKALALAALGKTDQSIEHLEEAIKAQPDFSRAYYHLGNFLLSQGKTNEVMSRFSAILETKPEMAEAHYFIGVALRLQGKTSDAIEHWRKAVQLKPDWVEVLNNLAWQLATQRDPSLRNGAEALQLSKRAVELTNNKDPEMLDTLAAAYAELRQFSEGAETLRQAMVLAQEQGQTNLLSDMQERLSLYLSAEKSKE